jgi:small subunit ribosomal protein S9
MATKTEQRYIEGIGRRKAAVARVRITPSKKFEVTVNDKTLADYFDTTELQNIAKASFEDIEGINETFSVSVHVNGGGIKSQAESVRLGSARALVEFNEELRKDLKKLGYLKRDPRVKERKKPGLKKARKSAQWSKR